VSRDLQRFVAGIALGSGLLYLLSSDRGKGRAARSRRVPQQPRRHRPKRKTGARVNRSSVDGAGNVRESPETLLAQARKFDPLVSLDELAAARLIASEYARGTDAEWAAIIDTELNRSEALYRPLAASLMGALGRFGRQGSAKRPASTARDPQAHLAVASAVFRSGRLRGISRGARRFFNPRVQDAMHRKWKSGKTSRVHSCSALDLLEAWSFDYRRGRDVDGKRRRRCPPDRRRVGSNTMAWVGPIQGVDSYELMLMAPMGVSAEHTRRYQASEALIRRQAG